MIDALLSTYFDIVEIQNKCECDQISQWTSFSLDLQKTTDFKSVKSKFEAIDQHLQIRSFLVGYDVTIADVCLWGVLKGNQPADEFISSIVLTYQRHTIVE